MEIETDEVTTVNAGELATKHLGHLVRFNTNIGAVSVHATVEGKLYGVTHAEDEVHLRVAAPGAPGGGRDWTMFNVPPVRAIVVTR